MKKKIEHLVAALAKTNQLSQTALAKKAGITQPTLNRFLNGKANLTSESLISVLNVLEIDLHQIIIDKLNNNFSNQKSLNIESKNDAITFLYSNLDKLGQQTLLKQFEWLNKIAGKHKIPKTVSDIIKKETNLI